ncbi:MAG: cytochrome c oxidase subunit II [Flammeovirgaceae bacterium]
MTSLLLITGIIFVLVLLGVVYRVITLVEIAKGKSQKRVTFSNKVNAILFPIFFVLGTIAVIWYSGIAKEHFLPEAASEHGKRTDFLFWVSMAVIGIAFFLTNVLLFFFPFIYQYKEGRTGYFYPHNDKLEIVWTIIPAVVMAALVLTGWMAWSDITSPAPKEAVEVEIMGKQFNWQVRYGGKDGKIGKYDFRKIDETNSMGMDFADARCMDDFTPREIHLPKGQPVLLKIRARDVLHSVFMPHFRVKMDAVPGMPTQFWFKPDISTKEMREKTGNPNFNYELACTEVCGSGHFAMRMVIIVDEPEDFQKWASEQKPWAEANQDYITALKEKGVQVAQN